MSLLASDFLLTPCINVLRINQLADPGFFKPSKIDILIGAQYFFELIDSQQIYLDNGRKILRKSVFGFSVAGSLNNVESGNKVYCGLVKDQDHTEDLNAIMKSFWQIENCQESDSINENIESFCEKHFQETYFRIETGKICDEDANKTGL